MKRLAVLVASTLLCSLWIPVCAQTPSVEGTEWGWQPKNYETESYNFLSKGIVVLKERNVVVNVARESRGTYRQTGKMIEMSFQTEEDFSRRFTVKAVIAGDSITCEKTFSDKSLANSMGVVKFDLFRMAAAATPETQPAKPADRDLRLALEQAKAGEEKLRQKDFSGAIKDFSGCILMKPDLESCYINRGISYAATKDLTSAIGDFNQAIQLNSNNADAFLFRGRAYLGKKDRDSGMLALKDFGKAIELNPKSDAAYDARGSVFLSATRFDLAIADFDQAIQINPNISTYYAKRGMAYSQKADLDAALKDYTQAIKLNPRDENAYANRGMAFSRKKDYEPAIADFTAALKINSKLDRALYLRALAYKERGDKDLAIADLKSALLINPNDEKTKAQLAELGAQP